MLDRLPDDILVDILSRLRADRVLMCRRVCRRWLSLTLSSHFAEIHLKRSDPGLVIQNHMNHRLEFSMRADNDNKSTMKHEVVKSECCDFLKKISDGSNFFVGSCNGLVALTARSGHGTLNYGVCNLVTQELVHIQEPVKESPDKLFSCFSLFFHPLAQEYRVLISYYVGNGFGFSRDSKIFIYGLKSRSWRELGIIPYGLCGFGVVQDDRLNWMTLSGYRSEDDFSPCESSIVTFNMICEEFRCMPHPGNRCHPSRSKHLMMTILGVDGKLALCCESCKEIDIWVLEDYANWSWVKKYRIDLNIVFEKCPHYDPAIRLLPLLFANGELYLHGLEYGDIFRYHLKSNMFKKVDSSCPQGYQYFQMFSHTPSFISLSTS